MDSPTPINILSLCSGIGGLDLGVKRALRRLGFAPRVVCYVEGEAYACEVLATQMEKGGLDAAPVWSDIRSFDGVPWRGVVDCVVGGYPCQPFSLAGQRKGKEDPRHIWPEVRRVLEETAPAIALFENVWGHVRQGLRDVVEDLSGLGFDAEWDMFAAREEGAFHIRPRLFVFAYADSQGQPQSQGVDRALRRRPGRRLEENDADADSTRQQRVMEPSRPCEELARDSGHRWWSTESPMVRGIHGLPARVDRIRALGNAVVPDCAERAFIELWRRAIEPSKGKEKAG